MTARHVYELTCDAPDCTAVFWVSQSTAVATRRAAAEIGWIHRIHPVTRSGPALSLDYCERHTAMVPAEIAQTPGDLQRTVPVSERVHAAVRAEADRRGLTMRQIADEAIGRALDEAGAR